MNRTKTIHFIHEIAKAHNAFDRLESSLRKLSRENLSTKLLECGIIPEMFAHDSSEEKLWAKYCDILLCKAFNHLNIQSEVLRARGDSADVFGKTSEYSIVGDAKAFRLSRTAKNQKDFKVTALDDWRKSNTFACLVSPLYQYPTRNSQIYYQAEERNVTLMSYIHLKFLLDHPLKTSLTPLWKVAGSFSPSKEAGKYWQRLEDIILELTGRTTERLKAYKQLEVEQTKKIGHEGVKYWKSIIRSYQSLTQREAVRKLIKAEKIEEKIRIIKETISKDVLI